MALENVVLLFLFLLFSLFNMACAKSFTKQSPFSNARTQRSFKVLLQQIVMPNDNTMG